ncbi:iron-containing redox enzyme family protein [Myxococcus stipitatus]|uniref:TenA family transcriptional regulator n=1 Tax=Myxococcus stipitatus TaxID=83455 RepID=UPI001F412261|nr:iron-containing redox enzyme family protein [Myxococcus stipitatus]MCE9669322.1 iron-containing redox enzyme family protein [Myxococcus stipitatus]
MLTSVKVVSGPTFESPVRRYVPPPLEVTAHPPWVEAMLVSLDGDWRRACWPRLFRDTADGRLPPLRDWRRVLAGFFPIVESFPKYMGLSLAKTTYGQRRGDASIRRWLLQNMAVEARHAEWYLDWLRGLGVKPEAVFALPCSQQLRALHEHLLHTCANGSLAEGIAASNWAIEGVTGVWTREVVEPFRAYAGEGARIDAGSMMWLKAHARYDDAHPHEALEIIKLSTSPEGDGPARVEAAARTSLRLYTAAIRACCGD